ncbi:MAG TPA: enoyl-CoA hydratase/isomerase family protein [Gemmatimonadales bacterium]|jgi:enoyl-CoA hydratase/carnithine racemase|nr:enoyl-CoA hydratase/isomerase family protein [Gemmatimonadales bacterium]
MEFWTSERRGAVEIATFSNPPRNYIGKPQLDELAQLVAQWRDPAIRAVVIQSRTGENTGFTQYSVEELYGMASDPALSRYAGAVVRGYKAMFDDMMALPKVVIAAMNGDALGGGFELTLACDLRIGQHGDFRYGNPEVRAGVMPGAGGTQRISRLVGLARALDWVLRGRIVPPEVALQLGLVHEVVDDAPTRALELAEEIAMLPPMSVANAKRALYLGADSNLQAAYEIENMNWTEVMQSDDAKVALSTFVAVDPDERRDWFESANSKNYPAYSGH